MPKKKPVPPYQRQKRKNGHDLAFVKFGGRRHYLGRFDSLDSKERYSRVLAEWSASNGAPPVLGSDVTIAEVIATYWRHCLEHYRLPDGSLSSQVPHVKVAARSLRKLYGSTLAKDFGPRALKTLRQSWVDEDKSRRTCNDYQAIIVRLFRWATNEELVSGGAFEALRSLPGLRKGRTSARETVPVRPVPIEHVEGVRPFVSRQVWAMIELQLLTGCRSGEVVIMRPIDLDMTGEVWLYTPTHHKTECYGHARTIYIGPKAQDVVLPFLNRSVNAYLFDPREAIAETAAQCATHRRDDQKPTQRKTTRMIRDRYDTGSYRRAIARACREAGVLHWHPHQLRHSAGTNVRKEHGLEAAQLILGHARCDVTQVYSEINQAKAIEIARRIG